MPGQSGGGCRRYFAGWAMSLRLQGHKICNKSVQPVKKRGKPAASVNAGACLYCASMPISMPGMPAGQRLFQAVRVFVTCAGRSAKGSSPKGINQRFQKTLLISASLLGLCWQGPWVWRPCRHSCPWRFRPRRVRALSALLPLVSPAAGAALAFWSGCGAFSSSCMMAALSSSEVLGLADRPSDALRPWRDFQENRGTARPGCSARRFRP